MGLTMAEKVIARTSGRACVAPGELVSGLMAMLEERVRGAAS